jgi:hypothetical protein
MGLADAVLLTLLNTVACLVLPKLISTILASKTKPTKMLLKGSPLQKARIPITSFPYCTVYVLTGSQFCKFSPRFCSKCSVS